MKQRVRHLLSVLLVCAMVLSLLPISVLAEELETPPTTVTEPANVPEVESEPEEEPEPAQIIYVSNKGNDTSGTGDVDKPYASLAKAVDAINNMEGTNFVIEVQSDLIATECARITDKNVTITSGTEGPHTITRGDNFSTIQDNARSTYNPAIIEVTTPKEKNASLTLENIVLDDAGTHEGEVFAQAATGKDNTKYVQDAIVAAYGTDKATAEIILGDGAVLQDFGGMSAVRVTGGAILTMKNGSVICDDTVKDRIKDNQGGNGPAGAVWVQGADVTMNAGAEIRDMVGRAFYIDSGSAAIGGTICNIKSDSDMWQGTGGLIAHVRNSASCTLKDGCVITNDFENATQASGTMFYIIQKDSELTMERGSRIQNWNGSGNVFFISGAADLYKCSLSIDGIISKVNTNGNHVVQATQAIVTIGNKAEITNNKVSYGTIYVQGGNTVQIYGKINYNYSTDRGGAVAITNHGDSDVYMYDGAEMIGNYSKETGGGLLVSDGQFIMNGGTISGNYATFDGGGVFVRQGGNFIMNGGSITGNYTAGIGGGIAFESGSGCVALESGTIENNYMNAALTPDQDAGTCSATGGILNDIGVTSAGSANISTHLAIKDSAVIGSPKIHFDKYKFFVENPANGVKLGNAAGACETATKTSLVQQNLTNVIGSLWYQTIQDTLPLTVYDLTYDQTKDLYAAVIETDASGVPVQNASAKLEVVEPDESGICHLVLPGNNTNGYAVVFMQEGEQEAQIVKVTPADITVYTGGAGYTGTVVGGDTAYEGLPEPGFYVTLPDKLEQELKAEFDPNGKGPLDLSGIVSFKGTAQGGASRTWTLEKYDKDSNVTVTVDGKERFIYRLVPGTDQDIVRVLFTDENGTQVTHDRFQIDLDALYQEYDMSIYTGAVIGSTVVAKVKDKTDEYTVSSSSGKLTVRGVVNGTDNTTEITTSVPSSAEKVTAVASNGTKYLINGSGLEVNDSTGVKLLVDAVEEDGGQQLKEYLGNNYDFVTRDSNVELKYLDLVDTSNGNVWIRPSQPMTIFWPYPEGADSNDTFYVIHFDGLDRNYDDLSNALENNQPENCKITRTSGGITFTVDSFSPFALVWKEGSSSGGGTGTRDDYTLHYVTNGGNHLSSETKSSSWTKDYEDLPTPVRDGYTFEGWYWDLRLTEPVTGDVKVDKTTVTLYAKWSEKLGPDDTGVSGWLETDEHNAFLSGYPDGSFLADKNMTRAEVAQMFYSLLLDKDVKITKSFSDVPTDAWYAKAVNTLSSLGMLGGYPDGTFRPDAPITRAEFAAIALAFAYDPASASCSYTDVSTSAWYYTYVAQATTYGWIGGYPDGSFRPNNSITRAEVAVIVNNMLGRDADESYINRNADELVSFVDLSKNHWAYYTIMESTNSHDYTASSNGESWKA